MHVTGLYKAIVNSCTLPLVHAILETSKFTSILRAISFSQNFVI